MRHFTLLLVLFLAGCGSYSANVPSIKPFKMDIQQGNAVTPKMMLQLRPGMNKSQVRFIMGTPLLADTFHADRWDYFYQLQKQGKIIEQRRIVLEFEDDKLKTVRGDVIPAGKEGVMTVEPVIMPKSEIPESKSNEKGLLDKLKFWEGDDKAKPAETKSTEAKPEAQPEKKSEPAKVESAPLPVKEEVKVEPAAKAEPVTKPAAEEKKGLLDKLKFWEDDKKAAPKVEPKPGPEIKPEPVIEFKPEPEPAPAPKAEVKPEPVPEPAAKPVEKEEKGILDKLKFWGDDEKAVPKAEPKPAPEVKPEPVIEFKPEVKAEPEVVKSAPKAPVSAEKPIPKPSKDLPAEDAPDYFEKMLEKIGF